MQSAHYKSWRLGTGMWLLHSIHENNAEQQMKSKRNLQNTVVDARRFIAENFDLVSHHPLETYNPALVL